MTAVRRSDTMPSPRVVAAMTDSWDHPRTMVGVSILCEWAAVAGVPAETLLRGSHIPPALLTDPEQLIEARQEIAVIRALLRTFGDRPGLGVEIGRLYHLTAYGYYGFLLASCSSVRETMRHGLRYAPLTFAFSTMSVYETDAPAVVQDLAAEDVPRDIRRFVVERDLAAAVQLQRELLPWPRRFPLREVRLADDVGRSPLPPVFTEHFAVPVSGGHARTELVYDPGFLDEPLPMASPHTAAMMIQQCERIRTERLHRTGIAAQVRAQLWGRESLDVGLEEIAECLHYPPRTLRRRLAQEGTTFRAILDEVRWTVAEELLRTPAVSRGEIARRLGYRDWSSYLRARRRWQGRTSA
ncbi:AraC family transcriptional regulator ligand-binding domain-containing protein [Pseudonocardia halophobica]|uniref:AraC family transcriptional regulator n=1 Tax=Pseudonocardia halophobica TaxID=29401 RepID=UPI003D8D57E7